MEQRELFITTLRDNYGLDLMVMIDDARRYIPQFNEKKFVEAFYFAAKAHDGQLRKENKPYIIHPVETVRILISLHADEDTLIAAFLHDVPEDTSHTIQEIENKFGKKIAFLVNGITKLAKVHFRNDMAKRQIESLKKLFIYSAEDARVILIKLADRLHNMRTLQYIDKPEKRTRIARETLEIFVPIANLLGIEELKSELEDLCFQNLLPDEYENISDRMKRNKIKNQRLLDETMQLVQQELDKGRVKAVLYGRQKNYYSIYKKVVSQGKRLDELDDFIALRILVSERDDCYKVLGIIHTLFKPKPGKFKDYIAVPKINGYQSLHTTVFGLNGMITEFQIRTHQMHLQSQYGIAAKNYEQNSSSRSTPMDYSSSSWVKKILEIDHKNTPDDAFIKDLTLDLLQDRIFVFTPNGDPIDLPKDATCIDFAYCIHTQVGHNALKADINGVLLPMTTVLKTGDTVRIITSDKPQNPNREWLFFAKTNTAKTRIRDFFHHESKDAKIRIGKKLLQKEFDRIGLGLITTSSNKKIRQFAAIFPELHLKNFDDILASVGDGSLHSLEFIDFLMTKQPAPTPPSWLARFIHPSKKTSKPQIKVTARIFFDSDKPGQLKSVLNVIDQFQINLIKSKGRLLFGKRTFVCKFFFHVQSFQQLSELFENFEHIEGVQRVERLFWQRKLSFLLFSIVTIAVWLPHPLILYFVAYKQTYFNNNLVSLGFQYLSVGMLFFMVYFLKRLTQRSFPELRETNRLWVMTFVLSIFAFLTFFAEIFYFKLHLNWVVVFGLILLVFGYLMSEYLYHRERSTL